MAKKMGEEKGERKPDNEVDEKKGLDMSPAYHKSEKNEGKGIAVRPATYTNRSTKGTGVNKTSAYQRKAGNL